MVYLHLGTASRGSESCSVSYDIYLHSSAGEEGEHFLSVVFVHSTMRKKKKNRRKERKFETFTGLFAFATIDSSDYLNPLLFLACTVNVCTEKIK